MPPQATHPCGTNAAYHRHVRHDEQPCEACLRAHADYETNRRRGQ